MLADLLLSALALAGVTILWRKFLDDHSQLKQTLYHPLVCSVCFSFWLTFFFLIIFNPLSGWLPMARFVFSNNLIVLNLVNFIFAWMILGTLVVLIRSIYAALFEFVHYHLHLLEKMPGHNDEKELK